MLCGRYTYRGDPKTDPGVLRTLGPEYSELVRRASRNAGWMFIPTRTRRGWGARSPVAGVHPYILLNFHGTFFDFDTVGHELGHAIQFHLADTAQPFAASDPSWFTTEIPSQVQEFLLIHHLIQLTSDDRTRLAILCEFLDRLELVLIDQAHQAEFKQAMFEQVENGGTLTPAWVNAKNLELLRRYRGHAQGITVVDDFAKSSWDHRVIFGATSLRGFCVGFNAAAALALSQQILDGGEPEAQRYVAFLKAGCSKPAMQLLKEAGVDFSTAQPFEAAMKSFDRLVDEMEDTLARAEAKSMPAR